MTTTATSGTSLVARGNDWIDRLSARGAFLLVLAMLVALYLPAATYDWDINVDAGFAAFPAWNLVENGTLDLSDHEDILASGPLGDQLLVETDDGVYSNRNPGVIFFGVPFYAAFSPWISADDPMPMFPAALAAVLASASAMAVLLLVFRRLVERPVAIVASLLAGLGTATWSISADGLWTHGPSQLWLALGLLGLAGGRYGRSGLALGSAILTRPYSGFATAVMGLYGTWRQRSLRPAILVGLTAAIGVGLYLWYVMSVFGSPAPTGGYAKYDYVTTATDVTSRASWAPIANFLGAFVDPQRGMLWYSPFLLALVPGLPAAWRRAEDWVRAGALGGAAFLLVQYWVQSNGHGGAFFFGYRYPIEFLTLSAPLLVLAWREWVAGHARRQQVFRVLAVASVALQGFGAIFEPYAWA